MADEIASLALAIDSTSAVGASKALDDLAKKSADAERATASLNRTSAAAAASATTSNARLADATLSAAAASTKKATADTNAAAASTRNAAAVRQVLSQLDPLAGRLGQLGYSTSVLAQSTGAWNAILSTTGLTIGLAVAAVGAFAVALHEAFDQMQAYNRALAETNDINGLTSSQLAEIAHNVGEATGQYSNASKALVALVSSGRVATDNLQQLTEATTALAAATGQDVGKIAQQFASLADDPTAGIVKLNEQQHFLTATIFEQIDALQKQGDTQGAAALAQSTYANAMQTTATKIREQQGILERAWDDLKSAASKAWDAMLNVGRPTPVDQLKAQAAEIQKALDRISANPLGPDADPRAVGAIAKGADDLRKRLVTLNAQIAQGEAEQNAAAKAAENQRNQDAQIAAQQWLDIHDRMYATDKERRDKEIADFTHYAAVVGLTADQVSQGIDRINQKFAAKSGPQGDAGQEMLDRINQQNAALEQQLDLGQKLTSGQQRLAEFTAQVQQLESSPVPLTNRQKQILAARDQIEAALQYNVQLEAQNAAHQNALNLLTLQTQLAKQLALDQQGYSAKLAGLGLGPQAQAQLQDQLQITQAYLNQMDSLRKQLQAGRLGSGDAGQQAFDEQSEALKQSLSDRLAALSDYYDALDAKQGDWLTGVSQGLNTYNEKVKDVASQTKDLMTDAFNGASDAVFNFVKSGKLNLDDLTNTILDDLLRIAIQQSIVGALSSGFSSVFSGLFSGLPSTASWALPVMASAKGNVFDAGTGLDYYLNTILTSPTLFRFAQGGAFGLAGEAGDEAVMPLTRTSSGDLGVRVTGNTAPIDLEIRIVNQGSQPIVASSPKIDMSVLNRTVVSIMVDDVQRGGPFTQQLRGRL